MQLKSYVQGRWHAGERDAQLLRDATTGQVIAEASSSGIDFAGVLDYARRTGGAALRRLTFHERAALLKRAGEDAHRSQGRALRAVVCDRRDEGGFLDRHRRRHRHVVRVRRARARASCRTARSTSTATSRRSRRPARSSASTSACRCEGVAVQINAFNFPVWGMLEKFAPALLAGVPALVKPATPTALPHGARRAPHRRVGHAAGGLAAARLRQRRRPLRSPRPARTSWRSPARRQHRAEAARASDVDRRRRCASRRDRLDQLLVLGAGRRARHARVRRLRAASRRAR